MREALNEAPLGEARGQWERRLTVPQKLVLTALLCALAAVSIFVARPWAADARTYRATIAALDDKKETVTMLMTSSAAASVAVTAIPDDVGTPIAQELADLSTYFLLILSVLYFEKYALTILGSAAFAILLPLALAALGLHIWRPAGGKRKLFALKMAVTAVLVVVLIPTGMYVSGFIEATFKESIEQSYLAAVSAEEGPPTVEDAGDKSIWDTLLDAANTVVSGVAGAVQWGKEVLSRFIESVAIVLILSCAIPLCIFIAFAKMIKGLWGITLPAPRLRSCANRKPAAKINGTAT